MSFPCLTSGFASSFRKAFFLTVKMDFEAYAFLACVLTVVDGDLRQSTAGFGDELS
jgi:hypothetical protein